jgi:dTDP-4-dehydrorhamnose reductase
MKILVIGRTGQVAGELLRRCPQGWRMVALGREEADLTDPDRCAGAVLGHDADAVINAAAYTEVDRAEDEESLATVVNGAAPAAMAAAAAKKGVPFLHISTDYVFDGSGVEPWRPDDDTRPLGAYGRSKLSGEKGVLAAGGPHAILRTSWVFSAHGKNFVKTMLRLGETRATMRVVSDQVGGPTPAGDIASALLKMAHSLHSGTGESGIFHFSGAPDVSWADFARRIFQRANMKAEVVGIGSAEYPTKAKRPANSRLDCQSLKIKHGIDRPDWRLGLDDVLQGERLNEQT